MAPVPRLAFSGWGSGPYLWVSPFGGAFAKIHGGALGHTVCNFRDEGVVLLLAAVEGLVDVLPGWSSEPVYPVKSVRGHSRIVAELVDPDGLVGVLLLPDGQPDGNLGAGGSHPFGLVLLRSALAVISRFVVM